ncbi:hypothetical protein JB92DRAFT_3005515 [Gautieria morchelliformis]|nr:hypothetical protein JB92DRAFT_3005515 [Gautieria morchelliformis]
MGNDGMDCMAYQHHPEMITVHSDRRNSRTITSAMLCDLVVYKERFEDVACLVFELTPESNPRDQPLTPEKLSCPPAFQHNERLKTLMDQFASDLADIVLEQVSELPIRWKWKNVKPMSIQQVGPRDGVSSSPNLNASHSAHCTPLLLHSCASAPPTIPVQGSLIPVRDSLASPHKSSLYDQAACPETPVRHRHPPGQLTSSLPRPKAKSTNLSSPPRFTTPPSPLRKPPTPMTPSSTVSRSSSISSITATDPCYDLLQEDEELRNLLEQMQLPDPNDGDCVLTLRLARGDTVTVSNGIEGSCQRAGRTIFPVLPAPNRTETRNEASSSYPSLAHLHRESHS